MSEENYRIIQSYLNLLCAIKDKAENDGFIEEFEAYWMYSEKMVSVWKNIFADLGILIDK